MKTLLILFSLLSLTLLNFGCSSNQVKPKNKIIQNINLLTERIDNQFYVSLESTVSINKLSLPAIDLPIVNPKNPEDVYGRIKIESFLTKSLSNIALKVNISKLAKLPNRKPFLPNGHLLPIAELNDNTHTVELKIDKINSSIYIALDKDLTAIGYAIVIKQFDAVSNYVGNANIFFAFDIKGVKGITGIFTGKSSMESGLAVFANFSSLLTNEELNRLLGTNTEKSMFELMGGDKSYSVRKEYDFLDKPEMIKNFDKALDNL